MEKDKHIGLRVDRDTHRKLKNLAEYEGRSINGELIIPNKAGNHRTWKETWQNWMIKYSNTNTQTAPFEGRGSYFLWKLYFTA